MTQHQPHQQSIPGHRLMAVDFRVLTSPTAITASQHPFSSMTFDVIQCQMQQQTTQSHCDWWPLTSVLRSPPPSQHHSSSKQSFSMTTSTHIPASHSHCSAPHGHHGRTLPIFVVPHSRLGCVLWVVLSFLSHMVSVFSGEWSERCDQQVSTLVV